MPKDKLYTSAEMFCEQMKNRLGEKKRQGFTGWDAGGFDAWDIPRRMFNKSVNVLIRGEQIDKRELVDIANFAMMLHEKLTRDSSTGLTIGTIVDKSKATGPSKVLKSMPYYSPNK